jgi:Calx-beta domain
MISKQNRVLALLLLVCAAAVATWCRLGSNGPTSRSVQNIEPYRANAANPIKSGAATKPGEAVKIVAAEGAAWNLAERTIQFFNDPELAPSWAIKSGQEFWRSPVPVEPEVVERVNHALVENPVTGVAEIDAGNYYARADRDGLKFSPSRVATMKEDDQIEVTGNKAGLASPGSPQADPTTEILVRTLSIQRDGQYYFSADRDATSWSIIGNTAQAQLSANWGMVEHYRAGNDGLAVTWIFPQPLPGSGSIEVAASIEGLTYLGETENGRHFADRQGNARVWIGRAEAVDAAGTRWDLETRVAPDRSGKLIVELPVEIQAEAVYPLAIDPVIGPEFGLDQPVACAASGTQADGGCDADVSDTPETTHGPVVQFSRSTYSVREDGKVARVHVTLTGNYSGVVTVDFSTADQSAHAGTDYLPVTWRLVFANNKTKIVVPIPILTAAGRNETVSLTLQDTTGGAVLGPKHTATLTIK